VIILAGKTDGGQSVLSDAPRSLLIAVGTLFHGALTQNCKHFAVLVAGLRKILLAKLEPCE
jgi:hypothetical protein